MDRVFLDANILFSAAYRAGAGLLELWKLSNVVLCSSRYALEEARINLSEDTQHERLEELSKKLELFEGVPELLPPDIFLPEKDIPILAAAIASRATHLLTGDIKHFGPFLGKKVAGVRIDRPANYLRSRLDP
jgi:predicted nucleic acid-binding protein